MRTNAPSSPPARPPCCPKRAPPGPKRAPPSMPQGLRGRLAATHPAQGASGGRALANLAVCSAFANSFRPHDCLRRPVPRDAIRFPRRPVPPDAASGCPLQRARRLARRLRPLGGKTVGPRRQTQCSAQCPARAGRPTQRAGRSLAVFPRGSPRGPMRPSPRESERASQMAMARGEIVYFVGVCRTVSLSSPGQCSAYVK